MNIDIAYRLSKLRRDRGYSQEKLAEELGVSRQAVSKWERAESSPDTDNLIALADLYGMSLDELLKGSAENADAQTEVAGNATSEAVDGAAADGDASVAENLSDIEGDAGVSTGASAETVPNAATCESSAADTAPNATAREGAAANGTSAADGGDHVTFNFHDGLHVHDRNGADVKVGWGGVHVNDPESDAHVNIGPGGLHVEDGEGNAIHGDPNGGYNVNGVHYDTWKDAHNAVSADGVHTEKGWMSRFPYAPIALVIFLCMGIFAGLWGPGLIVLLSTGIWMTLAHLVDTFHARRPARKRREAVTSLTGTLFLFAFFAAGLIFDAWHPGWILIVIGFVACGIINACWHVNDESDETDASQRPTMRA